MKIVLIALGVIVFLLVVGFIHMMKAIRQMNESIDIMFEQLIEDHDEIN